MISQYVYNLLARPPKLFLTRLALWIRELLIKYTNDPLVDYQIEGFDLRIPLSHELGIFRAVFPEYGTNLARLTAYIHEKYPRFAAVDVGANVGDTVVLLKNKIDIPVLAIEPKDTYFAILEQNTRQLDQVYCLKAFVGEINQTMGGKRLQEYKGTSVLQSSDSDTISVQRLPDILETHPTFKQAKLLKIDTDGFDIKIIRGAADWLKEVKPIIFFEYIPSCLADQGDNGLSIFPVLASANYQKLILYYNNGDYMLSLDIENKQLLEDIHHYFSGRDGAIFCDICAFHTEDTDLFEQVRRGELAHFQKVRGY